jgi:hypothetical protein
MRPAPFKVPRDVRITRQKIGGVAGEWVEDVTRPPSAATLLYLHGGGYVGLLAKTRFFSMIPDDLPSVPALPGCGST